MSAAFQGAIAPTHPTGRRMPIAIAPGRSDGSIWPIGTYAAPAAWRKRPGRSRAGTSRSRSPRRSRARASERPPHRDPRECRPLAGRSAGARRADVLDQAAKACRRRLDRRVRTSSARPAGTRRDDVARERIEVLEGRASLPPTHSPSMNWRRSGSTSPSRLTDLLSRLMPFPSPPDVCEPSARSLSAPDLSRRLDDGRSWRPARRR